MANGRRAGSPAFGDAGACRVEHARDLAPLFDDLPSPRPSALFAGASAPLEAAPENESTVTRWMYKSAVPVAVVLAIAVFILTRGRVLLIFALPMVVAFLTWTRRR